jgi:hypothetical protein
MRATQYPELGYDKFGRHHWQFVATDTASQVGPIYPTKTLLLADLQRYARLFGCEAAPEDPKDAIIRALRGRRLRSWPQSLNQRFSVGEIFAKGVRP